MVNFIEINFEDINFNEINLEGNNFEEIILKEIYFIVLINFKESWTNLQKIIFWTTELNLQMAFNLKN